MATNSLHTVIRVLKDHELWHSIRNSDTTWSHFGDVERHAGDLGINLNSFSIVSLDTELHVIVTDENDQVYYTVRSANGSWSKFRRLTPDGTLYGLPASAAVLGEIHVVTNANGRLFHGTLNAGGWSGFEDIFAKTGFDFWPYAFSVAQLKNELYVFVLPAPLPPNPTRYESGTVLYAVRHIDNSWTPWRGISTEAPTNIGTVVCANVAGKLHAVAPEYSGSTIWHNVFDGQNWQGWKDATEPNGNHGKITNIAVGECAGELHLGIAVEPSGLWHTILHANDNWQGFKNLDHATGRNGAEPAAFIAMAGVRTSSSTAVSPDPFLGVAGASQVVLINQTVDNDTLTVWAFDNVTRSPTKVGVAPPNGTVTIHLTNLHPTTLYAISKIAVDKANAIPGNHFDVNEFATAQVVEFQRAYATELGRSNASSENWPVS